MLTLTKQNQLAGQTTQMHTARLTNRGTQGFTNHSAIFECSFGRFQRAKLSLDHVVPTVKQYLVVLWNI